MLGGISLVIMLWDQNDFLFVILNQATTFKKTMTQAAHSILKNALSLSESDRALLAGVLLESLESDHDVDVEKAWLEEVNRRVADLDAGSATTIPLEQVISQLRQSISGTAGR